MSFKKISLVCFISFFSWTSFSEDSLFLKSSCFKDMKRYYPYLTEGELNWEQQQRFFHCLHGTLDLIVNKKLFTHDSSRDYFTREEIFRLFHSYFEYDAETSDRFVDRLLAVKKILIGGSMDRLKDSELSILYSLVYDYK
ncbi:MAG: hypothetical protein OXN83_00500, partial [Oligoflexia bacterium]|nr:hypothetical protein [Oligoflexia bacterium]